MSWTEAAMPLIEQAPTIIEGLTVLFTHLHNEMAHGQGQTNPVGVVEEALVEVGKLAAALEATPSTSEAGTSAVQPAMTHDPAGDGEHGAGEQAPPVS